MENKKKRSFLCQAEATGYCIGKITVVLKMLLRISNLHVADPEIAKKLFAFYQLYVPTLTWEMYQDGMDNPRNILPIIQEVVPKFSDDLYQELVQIHEDEGISAFIRKYYLDVFEGSPLWEKADDQFDEDQAEEKRKVRVHEAMEYLAAIDEDQDLRIGNNGKEKTDDFVPVLLWQGGTRCKEDPEWRGNYIDARVKQAEKYLKLPSLTTEEVEKSLNDAEPEQEIAVRCANAVIAGSQERGYHHLYINMVNPQKPWMIKCYRREWAESVGYVQTDKYGFVTDDCMIWSFLF